MNEGPRLTTVMGVARAVLATVGPRDAVRVLVDEFGWDVSFQALALLPDPEARPAFAECWGALVLDGLEAAAAVAVSRSGAGAGGPRRTRRDPAPG